MAAFDRCSLHGAMWLGRNVLDTRLPEFLPMTRRNFKSETDFE
jgi:hypothetical protein